jgi:hypothetical protein
MVDISDTKHLKTVLVSNFVVRVSQSTATAAQKRPRARWLLHMQTTTAALTMNAIVSHQLEHNKKEKDGENGDNTGNST